MIVKAKVSALKDTKWHEYALRFVLGGRATVGTGVIASKYGHHWRALSRFPSDLLRQRHID
jgi:hypothetical protein